MDINGYLSYIILWTKLSSNKKIWLSIFINMNVNEEKEEKNIQKIN